MSTTTEQITDCPLLRRGKGGHTRITWVREANRRCDHPDHRFKDAMHVPVEVELERMRTEDEASRIRQRHRR